jgi:hypothetical protein
MCKILQKIRNIIRNQSMGSDVLKEVSCKALLEVKIMYVGLELRPVLMATSPFNPNIGLI